MSIIVRERGKLGRRFLVSRKRSRGRGHLGQSHFGFHGWVHNCCHGFSTGWFIILEFRILKEEDKFKETAMAVWCQMVSGTVPWDNPTEPHTLHPCPASWTVLFGGNPIIWFHNCSESEPKGKSFFHAKLALTHAQILSSPTSIIGPQLLLQRMWPSGDKLQGYRISQPEISSQWLIMSAFLSSCEVFRWLRDYF